MRDAAASRGLALELTSSLADLAAGTVVIAAVPEPSLPRLIGRSLESGLHVIAPCADPDVLRSLLDLDASARAAGVTILPCQGWDPVVADLLASRAARDVTGPFEVHVAYALPGARLRARSVGERDRLGRLLGRPFEVRSGGRMLEERDAETRRLAWYPRPVGPRHAAGVPGVVVHTVPRHEPGARTVGAYRAMSTAAAEARQLVANVARTGAGAALVRAVLDRGPARADAREQRWACIVEACDGRTVSRAWAHGTDHLRLTATSLVESAAHVGAGGDVPVGVLSPAQLRPPDVALDALASLTDLRWGRARGARPGG